MRSVPLEGISDDSRLGTSPVTLNRMAGITMAIDFSNRWLCWHCAGRQLPYSYIINTAVKASMAGAALLLRLLVILLVFSLAGPVIWI